MSWTQPWHPISTSDIWIGTQLLNQDSVLAPDPRPDPTLVSRLDPKLRFNFDNQPRIRLKTRSQHSTLTLNTEPRFDLDITSPPRTWFEFWSETQLSIRDSTLTRLSNQNLIPPNPNNRHETWPNFWLLTLSNFRLKTQVLTFNHRPGLQIGIWHWCPCPTLNIGTDLKFQSKTWLLFLIRYLTSESRLDHEIHLLNRNMILMLDLNDRSKTHSNTWPRIYRG